MKSSQRCPQDPPRRGRRMPWWRPAGLVGALSLFGLARVGAQPTAFTYQGQLSEHGAPATGIYDMRFVLRDAATGGNAVPGTPTPIGLIGVTNGLFSVSLDFGAGAFNGSARWLEIGVRTNGSLQAYTVLAPRAALLSVPYAALAGSAGSFAGNVADSQLSANIARLNAAQAFTGPVSFNPASGPPFAVATTNRVTGLNSDLLDGFSAGAFWNIGGNLGTVPGNFLGTLDSQPLVLRVNNSSALRLEPNATSPNIIAGHPANVATPGVAGAVIGGGGAASASNLVAAAHGTIAGGRANRVLAGAIYGAVGGGDSNAVAGAQGVVSGGWNNQANAQFAAVLGGATNLASGAGGAVGGGSQNVASGFRSTVAGGANNSAAGAFAAVAGGRLNVASGAAATVAGGFSNVASNDYAAVAGGFGNVAGGSYSWAGGYSALALHSGSFVWSDSSSFGAMATTGDNQFLIRASGGVGLGAAPVDAMLDVHGDVRLNDYDVFLRGGTDRNHGIGWYGSAKPFAGLSVDGPVVYGWSGGALGTTSGGARAALQWTAAGYVGLGLTPAVRLHLTDSAQTVALFEGSNAGGTWLSLDNTAGGRRWSLISTGPANGETAGQLLFFAGGAGGTKVTFRDTGNVGIGTVAPGERLEVYGPDATLRLRNQNDSIGGFIGNTYGSVQLGLYNPSAAAVNSIAAGAKRTLFGYDSTGKVGSMVNNYFSPSFRNLLDDGAGNVSVSSGGALNFGSTTRQMLNLWNSSYGIGVQPNTLYLRTDNNFAWYRGGAHAENTYDSGGGTTMMRLDGSGLTVNGTFFSSSDRHRKENFRTVKAHDVLDRLAALPIQKWNYKDDAGVDHIGPMAQDFYAAFGLGVDDERISMVDADGVALAAIQGLLDLMKERDAAIASLRRDNEALQKRLAAIEQAVAALAPRR